MMGMKGLPIIMTKRRRRSSTQIIRKLAEGNKLLAGGMTVEQVCRRVRDCRIDLASLAITVRGHESRRRETVEDA